MRIVAAPLSAKVRTIVIVGTVPGANALLRSPSLISVPSTVKCSSDLNFFACLLTSAKNRWAISEVSSRSRFLENTAWFHTASSIEMESERSVQIAWVVRFVVNPAFRRQPISPQAKPGDSGPVCSLPPKKCLDGAPVAPAPNVGWCRPTLEFTPNDTTRGKMRFFFAKSRRFLC